MRQHTRHPSGYGDALFDGKPQDVPPDSNGDRKRMIIRKSVTLGTGLVVLLGGALASAPCASHDAASQQQPYVQNATFIHHMDINPSTPPQGC